MEKLHDWLPSVLAPKIAGDILHVETNLQKLHKFLTTILHYIYV